MRIFRLLLALTLAAPAAMAKDWTKVVITTEAACMPYNGHAPDGTLIGFEIDLAKDLCARAKVTCEFISTIQADISPPS